MSLLTLRGRGHQEEESKRHVWRSAHFGVGSAKKTHYRGRKKETLKVSTTRKRKLRRTMSRQIRKLAETSLWENGPRLDKSLSNAWPLAWRVESRKIQKGD